MAFHCKCAIVPIKVGVKNEKAYVIHPCPVHEAAPDMLAALEEIETVGRNVKSTFATTIMSNIARKALAQVKVEKKW